MADAPHILVVGFGSAGRRHGQNLARRGARISVVDSRSDKLRVDGMQLEGAYSDINSALSNARFHGAVVATPTAFHVEQTEQLLTAGCRVLLEKPVALDSRSSLRLVAAEAKAGLPILLGYTWRWWSALKEMRTRLQNDAIGRPLRGDFVMASHLEDWHPGEPLDEFFMSRAELGGGALLDESHWIDQMVWMFGMPAQIAANIEHISSLPITSDDHVDIYAIFEDRLRVRVHLDLYTRPTERSISIYGDRGALKWSFDTNTIDEYDLTQVRWQETAFKGERNDMFDALAAEFLQVIKGSAQPSCTLADGCVVMQIIEAARESQQDGGRLMDLRR